MRQLAVELGSTDRERRNSLKTRGNSSNIESDEECFEFE
jgi:hypothetical protein